MVQELGGQCYVSFSGGKDSTVLAYIAASICEATGDQLILWFCDTGLEYPEVKKHVKTYEEFLKNRFDIDIKTIIDYPKDRSGKRITFKDVILEKGYPLISKEVARDVGVVQNNPECKTAQKFNKGSDFHKKYGDTWMLDKWSFLLDAPFKVSNRCCTVMKKNPAHRFDKESGLKPILGTMASESVNRKKQWIEFGCNAFNTQNPSSKPLSFWTDQDILKFIIEYKIPIAAIYGEIKCDGNGQYYTTGRDRTGCMFCGFGAHLEKEPNRYQQLKQTHPKIWEYCMKPIDEGGLGMREPLEFIGVKIE